MTKLIDIIKKLSPEESDTDLKERYTDASMPDDTKAQARSVNILEADIPREHEKHVLDLVKDIESPNVPSMKKTRLFEKLDTLCRSFVVVDESCPSAPPQDKALETINHVSSLRQLGLCVATGSNAGPRAKLLATAREFLELGFKGKIYICPFIESGRSGATLFQGDIGTIFAGKTKINIQELNALINNHPKTLDGFDTDSKKIIGLLRELANTLEETNVFLLTDSALRGLGDKLDLCINCGTDHDEDTFLPFKHDDDGYHTYPTAGVIQLETPRWSSGRLKIQKPSFEVDVCTAQRYDVKGKHFYQSPSHKVDVFKFGMYGPGKQLNDRDFRESFRTLVRLILEKDISSTLDTWGTPLKQPVSEIVTIVNHDMLSQSELTKLYNSIDLPIVEGGQSSAEMLWGGKLHLFVPLTGHCQCEFPRLATSPHLSLSPEEDKTLETLETLSRFLMDREEIEKKKVTDSLFSLVKNNPHHVRNMRSVALKLRNAHTQLEWALDTLGLDYDCSRQMHASIHLKLYELIQAMKPEAQSALLKLCQTLKTAEIGTDLQACAHLDRFSFTPGLISKKRQRECFKKDDGGKVGELKVTKTLTDIQRTCFKGVKEAKTLVEQLEVKGAIVSIPMAEIHDILSQIGVKDTPSRRPGQKLS
jgi:hypothetical protein